MVLVADCFSFSRSLLEILGKYFKELSAHNKDLHLVVFSAKRAVKDGFKSVIEAIKASFDGVPRFLL